MKKINLFIVSILFITGIVHAQTQRGYYIIGGQIANMNLGFQKNGTTFGMDITPRVAWFVQNNIAVGGEVLLGVNTSKGFRQFNYGVGPIARYYFTDRSVQEMIRRSRLFIDANIGIYGQNSKAEGESSVSTNGLGLGIGPGIAYFINQNIALEGLVKYRFTSNFGNTLNVNRNSNAITLGIGFQIHLPGSKIRQMQRDVK